MKNFKIVSIALALICFATITQAQIKLKDSGKISIGTTTEAEFGNMVWLYGSAVQIGGYFNRLIRFDLAAADPRIYSTKSNQIVFYNSKTNQFQTVEAKSFRVMSDNKLKTNINALDNALASVLELEGVSFNWKNEIELKSPTPPSPTYGFIAQQVETVLPDIVNTDSIGNKSIDPFGILPYVVESIKELNNKIETQTEYIEELESQMSIATSSDPGLIDERNASKLLSTQPNPFSTETTIGYYVNSTAIKAYIVIYDLSGKQLLIKNIHNTGTGSIRVLASELYSGKFLYSLIVDGIEIDTKKMIITN